MVAPRLLDHGSKRTFVGYTTAEGVVCIAPHTRESFLVDRNGAFHRHHSWPLPINGELPFGAEGAVAWSNGLAEGPGAKPGYVMFRRSPLETPVVQELSFRPGPGTWWRDRLYWVCTPAGVGARPGLASWAPDEPGRWDLPDVALIGIEVEPHSLLLQPAMWRSDGVGGTRLDRRVLTSGLRWKPEEEPVSVSLSPYGQSSWRAISKLGTATAYPQSDIVLLRSTNGRTMAMTCHYPFQLEWLDRSLLVTTMDRELLLFEGIGDMLCVEGVK
jgi:hypothetical protein